MIRWSCLVFLSQNKWFLWLTRTFRKEDLYVVGQNRRSHMTILSNDTHLTLNYIVFALKLPYDLLYPHREAYFLPFTKKFQNSSSLLLQILSRALRWRETILSFKISFSFLRTLIIKVCVNSSMDFFYSLGPKRISIFLFNLIQFY